MDKSYTPQQIEFFHGKIMDLFHEFRVLKSNELSVAINGSELNNIIAKAKQLTIDKYANKINEPTP